MSDVRQMEASLVRQTQEIFDWMHNVCSNSHRHVNRDVHILNGNIYATDGYRIYEVPLSMIDLNEWYEIHCDRFSLADLCGGYTPLTRDHQSKLPCAAEAISDKQAPEIANIIEQQFNFLSTIQTRDLWLKIHDDIVMSRQNAKWPKLYLTDDVSLSPSFAIDTLSLNMLLAQSVHISQADDEEGIGIVKFSFFNQIAVYIMPFWPGKK